MSFCLGDGILGADLGLSFLNFRIRELFILRLSWVRFWEEVRTRKRRSLEMLVCAFVVLLSPNACVVC